jgi:hypothetical protein
MIRIFNKQSVQAAAQSPAFNVVNPKFAATAAAEILNSIEWQVQV